MRAFRLLAAAAAILAVGVPAQAYYHYVYYSNRTGPYTPIFARYDTSLFQHSPVVFCVTDSGPANYFANDSFSSVLAQIKQAAAAWNAVPNSSLHVAFGGPEYANQPENTPGGDVVFEDLGPGFLGAATPNFPVSPQIANGPNGPFVPIVRSTVILTNNTSILPGPSSLEMYFTTAVHEFGHALGLQHTWTDSAMSQGVARNTSRALPLDADDIASFLELYGAPGWTANYGSISGRVTFTGGSGASLASVVAIPITGPAVSTLTNPDGTYTIDGLPPNNYLLYVHPLPPDAIVPGGEGLLLPRDASGLPFAATGSFRTVFYPNTLDPSQATSIQVQAGGSNTSLNFSVVQNAAPPAYDYQISVYGDPVAHNYVYNPSGNFLRVNPAFLNTAQGQGEVLVQANSGSIAVPTSVGILGVGTGGACKSVTPCFLTFGSPTQLVSFFSLSSSLGVGPRHMVLNFGNDIYVVPNALNLVQQGPPYISSVTGNNDGTVTIAGGNFGPDSRVFFDGLQATALPGQTPGSITVTPPAGNPGQVSTVTVFNADAQNSMQFYTQPQDAPTYVYTPVALPQISSILPASMPAGIGSTPYSGMVDIVVSNGSFVDGQVTVGAGSSDVTVTRVWVINPNHLVANLSVAPGAYAGITELSILSGFQLMTTPYQIMPPNASVPSISAVLSASSYQPTLYRGGYGTVYGSNLQMSAANLTLNGTPLNLQFIFPTQINFAVPQGWPTGPATLTLNNGVGAAAIQVPIGDLPPAIQNVASSQGAVLDGTHPANVGDVLSVLVTGIDPSSAPALNRISVTVSGLPMTVVSMAPAANGQYQIQFVMGQSFGGSQVPVAVGVDGSFSNSYIISSH